MAAVQLWGKNSVNYYCVCLHIQQVVAKFTPNPSVTQAMTSTFLFPATRGQYGFKRTTSHNCCGDASVQIEVLGSGVADWLITVPALFYVCACYSFIFALSYAAWWQPHLFSCDLFCGGGWTQEEQLKKWVTGIIGCCHTLIGKYIDRAHQCSSGIKRQTVGETGRVCVCGNSYTHGQTIISTQGRALSHAHTGQKQRDRQAASQTDHVPSRQQVRQRPECVITSSFLRLVSLSPLLFTRQTPREYSQ